MNQGSPPARLGGSLAQDYRPQFFSMEEVERGKIRTTHARERSFREE